jgi:hypothetical protein
MVWPLLVQAAGLGGEEPCDIALIGAGLMRGGAPPPIPGRQVGRAIEVLLMDVEVGG